MSNINNLKLTAESQEDLKVISAHFQDSIVNIGDMIFLKKNRIFIMLVSRFMWEIADKKNKRIRCALKFDGILEAKSKKINQKNRKKTLECLAIECNKILNNNYEIIFLFSGNSIITLIAEYIEVVLNDLGEAWDAKHIPKHNI